VIRLKIFSNLLDRHRVQHRVSEGLGMVVSAVTFHLDLINQDPPLVIAVTALEVALFLIGRVALPSIPFRSLLLSTPKPSMLLPLVSRSR
jgi:hypothetical protein